MQFTNKQNNKISKPIVLIILDGLGVAPEDPGNAVYLANTANLDKLWPKYPHGYLHASGTEVGLPFGVPGNSEVCHLNIGAGRIVLHDLPRIDNAINSGLFDSNPIFMKLFEHVKKNNSKLHILGLTGNGFAHSSINHYKAFLKLCSNNGLDNKNVLIHAFTDGRDSPPHSANIALGKIEEWCEQYKVGKIASLIGRYYAMDRDDRWERTQKAYDLLTSGIGEKFDNWKLALEKSYANNVTDEFLNPVVLPDFQTIGNDDAVIIMNFRSDRALQLTMCFSLVNFEGFDRKVVLNDLTFVTMSKVGDNLPVQIAFEMPQSENIATLSEIISDHSLKQFHIAESEKFPHVTYFFNGENHQPHLNETWEEIPSPRDVPTYDKKPEMSAYQVTDRLISEIKKNTNDFILVNFANTDMVGHTGVLEAGIKAVETVDDCLGKIIPEILKLNGTAIITSDHGNVDEMINMVTGQVDTEHSTYPVPFLVVSNNLKPRDLRFGRLADIAPTVLKMLEIEIPSFMTGRNLLD